MKTKQKFKETISSTLGTDIHTSLMNSQ